jgi:hypothetical protein
VGWVGSRQEGTESAIGIIRLRFEREGQQRDSVIDEAGSAEIVQRAADGGLPLAEEVGIDHRCSDVFVTEEFLHEADVVAAFEQVDGKEVAQGLWCDTLGDPRRASGLSDRLA